jgi:hypothetical protein
MKEHMDRRLQIVFDASDPHALAGFWREAVGGEVEDHSGVVRQLLDSGALAPDQIADVDGRLAFRDVAAVRAEGLPRLFFQRVPEPKMAKNRCHVDLQVGPERVDAERDRLVGLGAVLLWTTSDRGPITHTLQDPQGNEFCVS